VSRTSLSAHALVGEDALSCQVPKVYHDLLVNLPLRYCLSTLHNTLISLILSILWHHKLRHSNQQTNFLHFISSNCTIKWWSLSLLGVLSCDLHVVVKWHGFEGLVFTILTSFSENLVSQTTNLFWFLLF
jgi:hypothetical protein